MPGVVGYFDHTDIPGKNNVQCFSYMIPTAPIMELFSSGKINYVGQVIGVICADTPEQAQRAAKFVFPVLYSYITSLFSIVFAFLVYYLILNVYRAVRITYKNLQRPITNIVEAMAQEERVINMDGPPMNQGEHIGDIEGRLEIFSWQKFKILCLILIHMT